MKSKSSETVVSGETSVNGFAQIRELEADELVVVAGGQDLTGVAFKALGPKVGTSATNAGGQL